MDQFLHTVDLIADGKNMSEEPREPAQGSKSRRDYSPDEQPSGSRAASTTPTSASPAGGAKSTSSDSSIQPASSPPGEEEVQGQGAQWRRVRPSDLEELDPSFSSGELGDLRASLLFFIISACLDFVVYQ